ncbi:ABC transporter ATP-binding protein [Rhizobium sp. P32RR-XVIII]|uniref:ABC transporter ATP-binding protein n=1 Tax=Rhizobium sp. P32RR-XVIII TaxID=2726738 RepID=UPI001456E92F|nr:ABC transporter ATP-binding protein [Rhizobium sp. P32RR-XVIII]NLS06936.1 ABC transporter ATP-binding protein [Rhizobium sp. P32RR-XVIII]
MITTPAQTLHSGSGVDVKARPVLAVDNLRTSFHTAGGWTEVVKGVSFNVHAGETLAVVGESGSGKSVTAFSIMRLLSDERARIEGSVRLDGRDLLRLPEEEMRGVRGNAISMIFQEAMTSLNPVFTIGQQIVESLRIHRSMTGAQAEMEAISLLERVKIPAAKARYNDYPHSFSGGMRQRAMIAMALACRPKVLIADEPTTALDVTIQAEILSLIRELQTEEQMAVMFITHDMGVVAEIAERTVVMLRGEAVETGTTEEIFRRAKHPYTRALLHAVPVLGSMNGEAAPKRFPIIDQQTGEPRQASPSIASIASSTQPALEVEGLTTRFDIRSGLFGKVNNRIHAVENVSFKLMQGETLSLVGESGCGKSTIGRSIMRLIEPKSGSIRIMGEEIMAMAPRQVRAARRNIQMIFQDPFASLNPRRSVGQAIAEPFLTHRLGTKEQAERKVAELLEQVGLQPLMASRLPHQFSGGQRQRICIARALALAPRIIVADESVSALDVSVKAQVINLMMELQERLGLSFLFISHDMAVVERISHKVAVLYLGEIVEFGSREEIFTNPQHSYTKRLLSAVPLPDPDRRKSTRALTAREIKNPIRARDYVPPERHYRKLSDSHIVMEEQGDTP